MIGRIGGIFILGLCSASALAAGSGYRPSFHPDQLKGPPAGRPNEVLVLGSPHLSGLPDTFAPAQLEPLLARLAAWKPEAIAVEAGCAGRRRKAHAFRPQVKRAGSCAAQ